MSIFYTLLTNCKTFLETQSFQDLPDPTAGPNIYVQKVPTVQQGDLLPLILITPAVGMPVREKLFSGDSKDIIFPAQFTIVQDGNLDFETNQDRLQKYHETIRDLFHPWVQAIQTELNLPLLWHTSIKPLPEFELQGAKLLYDKGGLVVEFHYFSGV